MAEESAPTEYVFPPKGSNSLPRCSHDSVERLGVDAGQNQYARCRDCESVIVTFTPDDEWERQRERLSTEERNWNPLLDALRTKNTGANTDPRRDDSYGDRSLTGRIRARWRQFRER
ncbi:MAG: hypothetical protein V5A39_01645 [Haloarculaceae archaeon]